jgi:hypothetical protein
VTSGYQQVCRSAPAAGARCLPERRLAAPGAVDRALEAWSYRNGLYAEHLTADPDFRDWQTHWLPIANDYLVVDTAGDKPGRIFISDLENGAMTERAWPSLQARAEDMLVALTTGHPLGGRGRRDPHSPTLSWHFAGQ